jgi:hypothetical protein
MTRYFFLFQMLFLSLSLTSQTTREIKIPSDSLYQSNIIKSKLYGVYIPRDVDDALAQLIKLTDEAARDKLKTTDEETVAKKLHFGLGRWMEYNWNFVEGSRFSHHLREKGLFHHDDMVRFMLINFHRYLVKKPLDSGTLINKLKEEREAKIKAEQEKLEVLSIQKKGGK